MSVTFSKPTRDNLRTRLIKAVSRLIASGRVSFTIPELITANVWVHRIASLDTIGKTLSPTMRINIILGIARTAMRHHATKLRYAYNPTNNTFLTKRRAKVIFTPAATNEDIPTDYIFVPFGVTTKRAMAYARRHRLVTTPEPQTTVTTMTAGPATTLDTPALPTANTDSYDMLAPVISELLTIASVHAPLYPLQLTLADNTSPRLNAVITPGHLDNAAKATNDLAEWARTNPDTTIERLDLIRADNGLYSVLATISAS